MKNRTKKTAYNFISDAIPTVVIAIIGMIKVPLFIEYLGVETQGVYQLFSQLFIYLTLAEAGFATAVMYMLYRPVEENDHKSINQILSGARLIFYVVAGIIFIVGIALSFGLRFFIKDTDVNYTYIQWAFILFLLSNVVQYFFISYNIIFDINLKKYKTNIISNSVFIIRGLGDIVLILLGFDLIAIILLGLVARVIVQLIIMRSAKKEYPGLNLNEKEKDFSSRKHIKDIMPSKIASMIINNIDIVVVSSFLGLKQVAIYGVYNYIVYNINQFISKMFASSLSSVGNFTTKKSKDSYDFFCEFNTTMFFMGTIIFVPLYLIFNPFIAAWVGADMMLSKVTTLFFCLILMMAVIRVPANSFITVFGLFKDAKKASYIEGVLNLSATLILINYWGILGALVATLGAYFISDFFRIIPLYKAKFAGKYMDYYLLYIKAAVVLTLNTLIFNFVINQIEIHYSGIFSVLLAGFCIFFVNLLITYLIYKLIFKNLNIEKRLRLIFKRK